MLWNLCPFLLSNLIKVAVSIYDGLVHFLMAIKVHTAVAAKQLDRVWGGG